VPVENPLNLIDLSGFHLQYMKKMIPQVEVVSFRPMIGCEEQFTKGTDISL